jgi:FixJ family two-component response regulator
MATAGEVVLYVIDEDASVRDALCRLAVSAGFEARPFTSISQFAMLATPQGRGCVLLDSSQLAARRSTARTPAAWHGDLPVIVLCGSVDDDARRVARSFGARFLLNKPVDAQALFDAIAWVTEGTT